MFPFDPLLFLFQWLVYRWSKIIIRYSNDLFADAVKNHSLLWKTPFNMPGPSHRPFKLSTLQYPVPMHQDPVMSFPMSLERLIKNIVTKTFDLVYGQLDIVTGRIQSTHMLNELDNRCINSSLEIHQLNRPSRPNRIQVVKKLDRSIRHNHPNVSDNGIQRID